MVAILDKASLKWSKKARGKKMNLKTKEIQWWQGSWSVCIRGTLISFQTYKLSLLIRNTVHLMYI